MMILIILFLLIFTNFNGSVNAINDCYHHDKASQTINITIDNSNGSDIPACLNGDGLNACKTLDYALSHLDCQSDSLVVTIQNGTYNYSLNATNTTMQFWNYSSISIVGKGINVSIISCSKPGAGFAFFNSTKVLIQDITIELCGSRQNGTSYDATSKTPTVSDVNAALYFLFCEDVSIIRSLITNSINIGVVVYNTNRTLNVINSTFSFNRVKPNNSVGGGGFYAEFTFCNPGYVNATQCVKPSCSGVNFIFEGSNFTDNKASDGLEKTNTFIRASDTHNIAFGRGGGLSLIFKGRVRNSSVVIRDCTIYSNTATWGAGLFVEFQDSSHNNKVLIEDTIIDSNSCALTAEDNTGTGGGGARIGFISFATKSVENNTITFDNCTFANNDAYWGGGLSYYTFRERETINATNNVNFNSCSWTNNSAVLGSAIDLSVWHPIKSGVLSKVMFSDCNFTGNLNQRNNKIDYNVSILGTGAFYSDSIPVAFQNSVNFKNNSGSGMALSATSATFNLGCKSNFSRNTGWTGGAIALLGNAWLEIYNRTNFTFYKNSAILNGGAISVVISSRHDLLSSRNCFLQYSDQFVGPQDWGAYFKFINNTAPYGHGQSIFATSLLSCVWGNSAGSSVYDNLPFSNWTIFDFNGSNISNEISTEIARIDINNTQYAMWTVSPGQLTTLPIYFKNDFKMSINNSIYLLPNTVESNLTTDKSVTFYGSQNQPVDLEIVTDNPRIVSTKLKVNLASCPPGYVWINSSTITEQRCVCGYKINKTWDGIIYCDDQAFQAYIKRDYWAGILPGTCNNSHHKEELYTEKCPTKYCSTSRSSIMLLPSSAQDLSKILCMDQNRTGILCGECINSSYCVAINSRHYTCTANVKHSKWAVLLATEYLPSTIFLVTILFYDINLHSEALGSVIMYFQVYSALDIYSDGEIGQPQHTNDVNKGINFLYNIWNLEFLGIWLHPYCLAKNLNTMHVLMISYVSGFYPFLIIFVYILFGKLKRFSCCNPFLNFCIRLKWKASLKASIINGLSTFWTLAYTKLAIVSCLILSIGYLKGNESSGCSIKRVVYLQGNLGYFHREHLPYAIPALIILVFFIILPSLALLCYPLITRIMAKIKKYVNLDDNRLYAYISDGMERPFIRFKPLLDSFQGPYKPGCEFFAGLMYWYRLGIFFTYAFASGSKQFYINSVISIILIALISFFQPFRNSMNNMVMMFITINITLINLISLYNYYEDISDFMSWFQLLLIILPFVYFAGCAVLGIKRKIQDYLRCAPPAGLYTDIQTQEFDNSLFQNTVEE